MREEKRGVEIAIQTKFRDIAVLYQTFKFNISSLREKKTTDLCICFAKTNACLDSVFFACNIFSDKKRGKDYKY